MHCGKIIINDQIIDVKNIILNFRILEINQINYIVICYKFIIITRLFRNIKS